MNITSIFLIYSSTLTVVDHRIDAAVLVFALLSYQCLLRIWCLPIFLYSSSISQRCTSYWTKRGNPKSFWWVNLKCGIGLLLMLYLIDTYSIRPNTMSTPSPISRKTCLPQFRRVYIFGFYFVFISNVCHTYAKVSQFLRTSPLKTCVGNKAKLGFMGRLMHFWVWSLNNGERENKKRKVHFFASAMDFGFLMCNRGP